MECRFCKCNDLRACPGGCSWHKPGYCSACADTHLEQLADAALRIWEARKGSAWPAAISGKACEVRAVQSSLTVVDHIGAIAFAISADSAYLAPQYDAPELMPLFQQKAAAA